MADFVFNIAKGKVAYYATLPAASDALIVVPIETTGLEADATLKDYDTLALALAGTSNEQTTMGRKTVNSGITVTPNDTSEWIDVDMADITWTGATGNAISALWICYDADTGTGTDADLVPLVNLACALTPDGSDFTAQFATAGWFRAT